MHALHSTLLPPSAVRHSLYLPNFTPSTIYPLPTSHYPTAPEIKVVGNLIVAGGEDLRVFEIRETTRPILPEANGDVANGAQETEPGELEAGEEIEEDYFDTGPSEVRSNVYASYLAHLCREHRSSMRHCANFTSLPDTNSTGRSLGSRRYGRLRVVWMDWTD